MSRTGSPRDRQIGQLTGTWHLSGVNDDLEPFIQIRCEGVLDGEKVVLVGQATPAEFRTDALARFHTSEAAEQDSIMGHFLTERLQISVDQAAQIIGDLRSFRTQPLADLSAISEDEPPEIPE